MVNKYITLMVDFTYSSPGWRFWMWRDMIHKLAPGPQIRLHDRHPPRAWMRYWRTSDFSSGLGWPRGSGSTSISTKLKSSSWFRQPEIGVVNIFEMKRNRKIIFLCNRNRYNQNVLATEMIFVYKRGCAITAGSDQRGKREVQIKMNNIIQFSVSVY